MIQKSSSILERIHLLSNTFPLRNGERQRNNSYTISKIWRSLLTALAGPSTRALIKQSNAVLWVPSNIVEWFRGSPVR
ncbi:hypothetical protein M404DRAFT_331099 [Pisolithus tinctorius Marx 270]|uniref:Uncharacterized protein n=1 Tax=Pisolithus tinctorius Marx 270 TaxID=870435 RepID=A0A0C3IDV3_PISTI|nr:hypothetical protein M404DRAFT_331099 [Pisolithus tinctorius Marx 270]